MNFLQDIQFIIFNTVTLINKTCNLGNHCRMKLIYLHAAWGQDYVVSIATCCGMDGPGIKSWWG